MTQKTMIGDGFSSPLNDAFPAGLRVLVVDDDPTWLKLIEKMLKRCFYEVTTCGFARDALNLLRERKDKYDIVISDVILPDMDGFKLIEHVGLEMDLPVIMMSVEGETNRVIKAVQHGACDYLLKPIRMKELRNIWRHVFRKKMHEINDIEILEGIERVRMPRIGPENFEDGHILHAEDLTLVKKRKDNGSIHDENDIQNLSAKKARVVWSVDLHQKFVKAVFHIGFGKVGPKKILDSMKVPWLTRENVTCHLQKYRLCLSRLQENSYLEVACFYSESLPILINRSVSPSEYSPGSVSTGYSCNIQQNYDSDGHYGSPGNEIFLRNVQLRSFETGEDEIVSKPLADEKQIAWQPWSWTASEMSVTVDGPDPLNSRSNSQTRSSSYSESEINFSSTFLFTKSSDHIDENMNDNKEHNVDDMHEDSTG